jgi:hypothetical protein
METYIVASILMTHMLIDSQNEPYSEFKIRLCFLKAFGNLTAAVTLVGLEKSCILINLLMATYPFAHFLSVYFVDAKVSLSELYGKNVYWIDVAVICHS